MSDFDQECVDLPGTHGKAVKMECLCGWSKPEYKNAVSPFDLSATYKITYEDGAEVVIGGLPVYALAQGSFWYLSDTRKEPKSVFARDDRVIAYLARVGQILKREKPGECILPSQEEADCIIDGFDIPFEALKYGSDWACKNMKRWVDEWSRRGLIERDDANQNHGWRITRKSLKEKWKCWVLKRDLKANPKSLSLDGKEFVVVDANLGKVKRIAVESAPAVMLGPRRPFNIETILSVEYENAEVWADFNPWETLALGWVQGFTEDDHLGFFCNKQVVAAIGRAMANLNPFLEGEIAIPTEKEAETIIKGLDIPYPPISYAEAGMIRPCIKIELMKKWKKSGKLCQMKDGGFEIEKFPSSHNQERDAQIAKSGEDVAREAIEAEKHESLFAIGAAKQKKSRVKKKPQMRRWPKNKAEHRGNQMRLWGGEDGLKGFETKEMKTSSGKTCTYYVKIDPTGRMRIADTGEDAPAGYYSQSSRYYALKRNARVARRYSTESQQILWFACLEHMKFPGWFLDHLGNRGLIRKMEGKYAEMNFGKSARGRKFFDVGKTYFPEEGIVAGGTRLYKPRYTMIIEQVRIRPGSFEACLQ